MNAERLLAHYERVADAPDAVARLRRFILDLAVRGKLVEQDPADEPAWELLRRNAAERARLTSTKRGRVTARAAQEREYPIALPIPTGWELVELGDLALKITDGAHKTPTYVETGVPFVSVKDFSKGRLDLTGVRFIPESEHEALYKRCDPRRGDILIGRIGTLGRAVLVDTDATFSLFVSVGLIRFNHDVIEPGFFVLLLNSPFVEAEFDRIKIGGGTHTNKLNLGDLHTVRLPLPPFAEQRRIVAKVDELMALCDRLEAARANLEATRDRLAAATLARLNAPDPEHFTAHARFALDALPALTTRPDQIKALRQTILNLAVRGRLVEQDARDEPAGELLRQIAAEKARLTKLGEIGIRGSSPLSDAEQVFALPCGWVWCRLGELAYDSDSGWSPQTENFPREGDAWGVLKVSAVSWNHFDPLANKQVLPRTEPRPAAAVRKGDFLMSRANTAELIARAVIVEDEQKNLMMSDKIVRLRLTDYCNRRFPLLVNNYADFARSYYAANATGLSPSMKNVSRRTILDLPVPLPPLAEQHRIVARVNELMTLCDRLEASLATVQTARRRPLDALLAEALAPALTANSFQTVKELASLEG